MLELVGVDARAPMRLVRSGRGRRRVGKAETLGWLVCGDCFAALGEPYVHVERDHSKVFVSRALDC